MATIEFVPLKDFENDYEILSQYPYTIRRKSDHFIVKEGNRGKGYVRVSLNGRSYSKHRLIANQFLPNDDPEHKTQVDHKDKHRDNNHIENLRWATCSINNCNKTSYNNKEAKYVDSIPDESIKVDFYDTRTEHHEFENYYFHEGVFYYDNDSNYRILNININKTGCRSVRMKDKNHKDVSLVIRKFMEQHDLISA